MKQNTAKKAKIPQVGIFWYVPILDDPIIFLGTPYTDGDDYGDLKVSRIDHYSTWENLIVKKMYPQLLQYEYEEFPRGGYLIISKITCGILWRIVKY